MLVVAAVQLLEVFYQLLNDQIDWWYVLVGLLLSVPLLIAVGIWFAFFTKETVSSRIEMKICFSGFLANVDILWHLGQKLASGS